MSTSLPVEDAPHAPLPDELPPFGDLIGFGEVAALVGVDPATPWRWAVKGAAVPGGGRAYLKTWMLPGRRVTTVAAVKDFVAVLTAARQPGPAAPPPRTPSQRRRTQTCVDRALDKFGI